MLVIVGMTRRRLIIDTSSGEAGASEQVVPVPAALDAHLSFNTGPRTIW